MSGGSSHSLALPTGHPGDLAYRLAVVRLLSSRGRVTRQQLDAATLASKSGGLFVTHLLDAGVDPEHLATALAGATGLPNATRSEVRRPGKHVSAGLDAALCHSLLAVPFKLSGSELHIAFAVALPSQLTRALPRHVAWVSLEPDVRSGLMSLWPRRAEPAPAVVPTAGAPGGAVSAPGGSEPPVATEAPPAPALFAAPKQQVDPNDPLALIDPAPPPAPEAAPAVAPPGALPSEPGPTETGTGPDARELLLSSLKQYRAHAIIGGVVLLSVFGLVRFVDRTRNEVERRGSELGRGINTSIQEAARARAAEQGGAPVGPGPAAKGGSIEGAIVGVDTALDSDDAAAFPEACRALAAATGVASMSAVAMMQKSDLRGLALELTVLCEREGNPSPEQWRELRLRLTRVLAGENPTEGPRYQVDAPPAVRLAVSQVDAALQGGDLAQSCQALGNWRSAMMGWVEKFPPGPRMVRMMEVVENDWESFSCSTRSIEAIRGWWAQAQRKVAPER